MKTPLERATTLVEQQYKRNQEAVQLAKLASLAVSLEPHLLRRLRLELLPDADVGIEADLWFGPLVESRGVRAIVLNRYVVELLREKLADDRQLLRRVIALTEQEHAQAATTIRLEERLTALAVLNEPDAPQKIEEALRPALRTMQVGGEDARQLAQWAMRALPQAHPRVRESRNAIALALSATVALGGRPILGEVPKLPGGLGDMTWLLRGAISVPPTRIGVELVAGGVAFSEPGGGEPQLEIPATNPLVLSLAWKTDGDDAQMLVEAVPGRTVKFDADVTQVELRTLSGDEYLLSAVPIAATSPETKSKDLGEGHPEFSNDLFISYARLDNLPATEADNVAGGKLGKGWVDLLHERLLVLVGQGLGYEPAIWRHGHDLPGDDPVVGAINEAVTSSLLLVPIITPRYVQSKWCKFEMEAFHAGESPASLARDGFRSRVFKVVKTPLPDHLKKLEPVQIKDLLGYQFYEPDFTSGLVTEFNTDPSDKSYWRVLTRLAADITQALIQLKHPEARQTGPSQPAKFVYLAETTSDLTNNRELVRDELRQRGYGVLPELRLPVDETKQTEAAVREDLARCALSVHMIGSRYGSTPEDDPRSIVRIQEELAVERGEADSAFHRLLWCPSGLSESEISDKRQKAFIEDLRLGIGLGAEFLERSIEDLTTRILEKLNNQVASPAEADRYSKLKQVYLICKREDAAAVRPIKQYLFEQNLEVITGFDEGTGDPDHHRKCLIECDAALIYFGSGDDSWVRKNLEDLEDAYGYGRKKDWVACAVYLGAPPSEQKEDFQTHGGPYVIRNFASFDPSDLRDFVRAVQASEADTNVRGARDQQPRSPAKVASPAEADRYSKLKQVYLICKREDAAAVLPIKQYLFEQNLEVITGFDEGTGDPDHHRKCLIECDAALIYFGSGDDSWVRKNLEDLEDAYGHGRKKDWVACAVYLGAPPSEQKEDFQTHGGPYVIRNFASFDPSDLRDFVRAVQASEADTNVRGARDQQPRSPAKQLSKIFISYRRDDNAVAAHLLDNLVDHFGKDQIFMDIESIAPGQDVRGAIENAVGSCDIMIAIIGRNWLSGTDGGTGETTRRLDNPNDFVRLEIAHALRRDIPVIPVLVEGASMPNPQDLPDDLGILARRNAIELTNPDWHTAVDQLISHIERFLTAGRSGSPR